MEISLFEGKFTVSPPGGEGGGWLERRWEGVIKR
jgi:hypothetical protein